MFTSELAIETVSPAMSILGKKIYIYKSARLEYEVYIPYNSLCPSVCRLVGRSVGRSFIISYKGGKLHHHAPIGVSA